jgi:hypothetical protein
MMITYIAKHEWLRMAVWTGLLMSLMHAGGLPKPASLHTMAMLLAPLALLLLAAIRRRLVAITTHLMAFPIF